MKNQSQNRRAFTMVELAIVIAVLGLLTAIMIPVAVKACECARPSTKLQRVKNITIAFKMYATEYDDSLLPIRSKYIAKKVKAERFPGAILCGRGTSKRANSGRTTVSARASTRNVDTFAAYSASRTATALKYNDSLKSFSIAPLSTIVPFGDAHARWSLDMSPSDPTGTDGMSNTDMSDSVEEAILAIECEFINEYTASCTKMVMCQYLCDDGSTYTFPRAKFPGMPVCPDFVTKK